KEQAEAKPLFLNSPSHPPGCGGGSPPRDGSGPRQEVSPTSRRRPEPGRGKPDRFAPPSPYPSAYPWTPSGHPFPPAALFPFLPSNRCPAMLARSSRGHYADEWINCSAWSRRHGLFFVSQQRVHLTGSTNVLSGHQGASRRRHAAPDLRRLAAGTRRRGG